jgi:hypothetical protein
MNDEELSSRPIKWTEIPFTFYLSITRKSEFGDPVFHGMRISVSPGDTELKVEEIYDPVDPEMDISNYSHTLRYLNHNQVDYIHEEYLKFTMARESGILTDASLEDCEYLRAVLLWFKNYWPRFPATRKYEFPIPDDEMARIMEESQVAKPPMRNLKDLSPRENDELNREIARVVNEEIDKGKMSQEQIYHDIARRSVELFGFILTKYTIEGRFKRRMKSP